MAFSVIASTTQFWTSGNDASQTTSGIDTTGADCLIVVVSGRERFGDTFNTPTDSKSNSWTALGSKVVGTDNFGAIWGWYSIPSTVGSGHTFTSTHQNFARQYLTVVALSGAAQSNPISGQSGFTNNIFNNANRDQQQPGSVSPTGTDLFLAFLHGRSGANAATGIAWGSSFTEIQDANSNVTNEGLSLLGVAYKESATSENPIATISPSNYWGNEVGAFLVALKAAGGGGGAARPILMGGRLVGEGLLRRGLVH